MSLRAYEPTLNCMLSDFPMMPKIICSVNCLVCYARALSRMMYYATLNMQKPRAC
jgi:hypothetical protein